MIWSLSSRIVLTDDADALVLAMGDALERIETAVEPVRRWGQQLRVSTVATLGLHWLIPRLPKFRALHPDIDVVLTATRRVIDFGSRMSIAQSATVGGTGRGGTATLLFGETLALVAAQNADADLQGSFTIWARSRF